MRKFLKSFVYSFKGLRYAIKTQLSFQIECFAAVLTILLGIFLKLNKGEWLWISLAIALVLILELINTVIEVLVDFISPQQHPKAGAIKDLASAAVLIGAAFSIVVALFIFLPKLFAYAA
jgi:diacylglycerol kinase (ATP)